MRRTEHTDTENPVVERITDLLLKQGKQQKELTEYLGVTKTMYSEWKSGRTHSYRRHAKRIAEFLNSTPEYILYGDTGDPNEKELIRLYRNLNDTKRNKLLKYAQTI